MRLPVYAACAVMIAILLCSPSLAAVDPLEITMVLTNQIGYDIGAAKTFVVQSPSGELAATHFVVKDKADSRQVLRGELKPLGGMKSWQGGWAGVRYWKGDFTALDKAGKYVIEVGDCVSPTVTIGSSVAFKDLAPFSGLSFLKMTRYDRGGWQSDGVPGENNVLFCIAPGTLGLARAYEADTAYWKQLGRTDEMIEEIRWGLKGLIIAQEPDGRFIGTNPDGRNDTWAGLGIAALAHLARAPYLTADERADCLRRAKLSWDYYKDKEALLEKWGTQPDGSHYAPLAHGAMVLANTELYDAEKDQRYLDAAAAEASTACRQWNRWWPNDGGWAMTMWQGGIMPGCLADFATKHPKSVPSGVKNALRRWVEYVQVLASNPFSVPAFDRNHFFNPVVNPPWQVAENGRYITYAWALSLASRWSGKAQLKALAISTMDFVLGTNPAGICMVRDKGERPEEAWWGMVKPGSISNGMMSVSQVRGLDPTMPSYAGTNAKEFAQSTGVNDSPGLVNGNQFPNIYCTSEPWTPYNGWMLIALVENRE